MNAFLEKHELIEIPFDELLDCLIKDFPYIQRQELLETMGKVALKRVEILLQQASLDRKRVHKLYNKGEIINEYRIWKRYYRISQPMVK